MKCSIIQVVELLQLQDPISIEILYDEYSSSLYGIVLRILKCPELTQNVIQDTFLKAWLHGPKYDASKGQLFTWLLNIARYAAIDVTRTSHYRISKNTMEIDTLFSLPGGDILNPDTLGLRESVHGLSYKYKVLLDLVYFKGYTFEEAAEETGVPVGTVKTRVRYAILALRKIYML